jgi:hypothetical protein
MTAREGAPPWNVVPDAEAGMRATGHRTWRSAMMRAVLVYYVGYPELPMAGQDGRCRCAT